MTALTMEHVDLGPYRARLVEAREQHGRRLSETQSAFEELFRVAARSGQPLDGLRRYTENEVERFFAQTIPGPDGHVYWDGAKDGFTRNDGKQRRPRRWWWARVHGVDLDPYDDVIAVCGERNCINPEHAEKGRGIVRRQFTEEQCVGAIQVVALRLGRAPLKDEWDAGSYRPSSTTIVARIGSWSGAVRRAGYEPWIGAANAPVSAAQCIATVRFLEKRLGRTPFVTDIDRLRPELRANGLPSSPATIWRYLGRWPDALKKAGINR